MSNVVITGAGGGLGRALASVLASVGHNLILHHRHEMPKLDVYGEVIVPFTTNYVQGDLRWLTTSNEIVEIADKMNADVLINNAASYLNKPFDEMTDCEIKEVLETNLVMPMILTRKMWPTLKKNNGTIININSLAGKDGGKYETAYSASKHGLAGFSKSLQFDATKDGIRVVDVYVGKMITAMTAGQINQEKYINPIEVAKVVEQIISNTDRSYRVNEITLTRGNY
jgi:short-subunit dehydrogenase